MSRRFSKNKHASTIYRKSILHIIPAAQQINNHLKTKVIDSLRYRGSSIVLPKSSEDHKNKHDFYEFYSVSKGQFNLYVGSIPIHPQYEKSQGMPLSLTINHLSLCQHRRNSIQKSGT